MNSELEILKYTYLPACRITFKSLVSTAATGKSFPPKERRQFTFVAYVIEVLAQACFYKQVFRDETIRSIATYCNCNCNFDVIVIVITFYSPSCLGQETAKGPFGLRVKLPPAHLSTTHGGGFILSL